MNFDLVILDGPEAGRRIPVANAPVTFGRAPAAGMTFPDDGFISSVHLSVQSDSDGVRITDLRSTNGTFLNGERVSSAVANVGDVIQIGTMTMQVAAARQTPVQPAAPVFSSPRPAAPSGPPSDATFFGSPVLPRMDIPAPPPMAHSVVATTTIPRISVDGSEEFRRLDTVKKTETDALQTALRRKIQELSGPLFLLINAAADDSIPAILAMADVEPAKSCLWQNDAFGNAPKWAPYLVSATADSPLVTALLNRGWGKNWVSLFTSSSTLNELLGHFGKFLKVQMDQTGKVYFPFYEPKVLREFLPSGNAQEIAMFFGPVREWLLEGDSISTLLQASNAADGLKLQTIPLPS